MTGLDAMRGVDVLPGIDIQPSTFAMAIAAVLALAVVIASVRLLVRRAWLPAEARPHGWRTVALLALQAASAVLLYLVLFPPAARGDAGTLVVLTRDAQRASNATRDPAARVIALPEAAAPRDAERVPDLATALRRWPGTTRLQVVGAGLVARDRDAAAGHSLAFSPAPLPRGVVGLHVAPRVQAGRQFTVAVDVHALPGGSVELLDPAGAAVDRAVVPTSSAGTATLRLGDLARSAGIATWRVRLRDAARREMQAVDVPLLVDAGIGLRVLMLAGAPNAELKYLRRWATDGGLALDARISLGGGLQIGAASARLDDATLARTDLLVLDQRAWQSLGDAQRAAVDRAVRTGLGLLLRLPDPLSSQDVARLRSLGFTIGASAAPLDVRLAPLRSIDAPAAAAPAAAPRGAANASPYDSAADGSDDSGASGDAANDGAGSGVNRPQDSPAAAGALPTITRSPARVMAIDGTPLLSDATGAPLAVWRAQGRGRIGVASIGDTWRLVLAGHDRAYDRLWSPLFETLARAARADAVPIDGDPRVDQRTALCGLADDARIEPPARPGTQTTPAVVPLRIDPRTGARRCAAYWPASAGWHRLRDGERERLFHVRAADDAPGLRDAIDRSATIALVGDAAIGSAAAKPATIAGARWPWLLAWLVASGMLWWLERRRAGSRQR